MWRCGRPRSIRSRCKLPRRRNRSRPDAAALQQRLQRVGRAGLWQPRLSRKAGRKPDLGAIAGDEDERNLQRLQPFGDRKTLFADQADIEQREIRRRDRRSCRAPWPRSPAVRTVFTPKPRIVSSKSSAMIGSSSTINTSLGMPSEEAGSMYLASSRFAFDQSPGRSPGRRTCRRRLDKRAAGSRTETTTCPFYCLFTCEHINRIWIDYCALAGAGNFND